MYVVLAQSIISLATEQGVELHTEDDLLQCYTVTTNCRVFHEVSSPYQGFPWDGKKINHTYPQYVGVNAFPHTRPAHQASSNCSLGRRSHLMTNLMTSQPRNLAKTSQQTVCSFSFLVRPGC